MEAQKLGCLQTYWTEGDVGTLPEEGEDDHLDRLADHGHDVGPQAVHEDLLLGEGEEKQQQAVVWAQLSHQQPEVGSGPEKEERLKLMIEEEDKHDLAEDSKKQLIGLIICLLKINGQSVWRFNQMKLFPSNG